MPRAPRHFEVAIPESQDEMLRTPRQIDLETPQFLPNANFECCFCLQEFEIYPEPKSDELADDNPQVIAHIRQCHSKQWELVRPSDRWTQRIGLKARPDLLTETS